MANAADDDVNVNVLRTIGQTFVTGLARITGARIVSSTLRIMVAYFHQETVCAEGGSNDVRKILDELARIREREFDSFVYVDRISQLVYATALFDTFLTDITRFLFLLHPRALGDNVSVSLGSLLAAESKGQAITAAVNKKTETFSYLSFLKRIEILNKTFGLCVELGDSVRESLKHYAGVRNTAIHDQGYFDMTVNDQGSLSAKCRACPLHPTPLDDKDWGKALNTHMTVAQLLYSQIATKVLKVDVDGSFAEALKRLQNAILAKPPAAVRATPASMPTSGSTTTTSANP